MDMEVEPSVSISSSKKRKHYRTISSDEEFDDSILPMKRLEVRSSFNASDSYVAYYRGIQFDKLRQLTGYYSCYGYL